MGLAEKQKSLTKLKQDLASCHILCEQELSAENKQQVKLHTQKHAELIIGNIHARFPGNKLSVLGSFFPYSMLKPFFLAVIVKNLKYTAMRVFDF